LRHAAEPHEIRELEPQGSQVSGRKAGVAGDAGQHGGTEFNGVVKGKHEVPHCRLTCQPMRNNATLTRLALVDGQTLMRRRL
jgi:hypothetical protein